MRKEYHESQKVEELMKYGVWVNKTRESNGLAGNYSRATFNNNYRQGLADINLLIKYYDIQGLKPKAIRSEIERLWVNYNQWVDGPWLTQQIAKVRKRKDKYMVDIESVKVSKEALDWFAQMMLTDSDEWNNPIPNARVAISERSEGLLGFGACKLMFVYYIWVLIQSQYKKSNPAWVNVANTKRRLLKEAHFNTYKKVREQYCKLYDWGLLYDPDIMSYYRRYENNDPLYMSFYDLIPSGEETIEVDFENPRKWFEDYFKQSDYVEKIPLTNKCPICGKFFVRKSHRRDECCPDCRRIKERDKKRRQRAKQKNAENGVS